MILRVTNINFDFTDDYVESVVNDYRIQDSRKDYERELIKSIIGETYEVETEDDLADTISDQVGWCVSSLEYEEVR
jgi:hypothetical protein